MRKRNRVNFRRVVASIIFLAGFLGACGGGGGGSGGSSSPAPQPVQSLAGIWIGQLTAGSTTNDVSCLVTEPGDSMCALFESGTSTIIGGMQAQLSVVNADELSGSGTVYTLPGYVLPDGVSTVATFTVVDGSVTTRNSVELTFGILGVTGTLTASFDSIYDNDSSLDIVAGSYSRFEIDQSPASFFIDEGGFLSGRTGGGCVLSGRADVVDPTVNGYSIEINLGSCPGINGAYSGLAIITDSVAGSNGLLFGAFTDVSAIVGEPLKTELVTSSSKLISGDGDLFDNFGISVATDGVSIAIGANLQEDTIIDSGAVYVFTSDDQITWVEDAKIKASDPGQDDLFGAVVDIEADTMVSSSFFDDDFGSNSGSVYVFKRIATGVWEQQTKLTANDGSSEDRFGIASGISDGTVVVGSPFDDVVGSNSGSGYVFSIDPSSAWIQTTKLIPTDAAADAWFGHDAAIHIDTIVVGARRDGGDGAVYVYDRDMSNNWSQSSKLKTENLPFAARFGTGLAIDGGSVVVGAFRDDENGTESGSAYVFTRDNTGVWSQQAALTPSDGAEGDWFGHSADIDGDTVIVGAENADGLAPDSGAAYLFQRDGSGIWSQTHKIVAGDGAIGDRFGRRVSMRNNVVVVGAPGDDDNGEDSGSVYVFRLDEIL